MGAFGNPGADYPGAMALERERLLELLASISSPDWLRPTPCPAWDVGDLCRHLLGDDLHTLSALRDHHHGTAPPPELDRAEFIGWLDELQTNWVDAARRISPALVVELLRWTGPQVVQALARVDPMTDDQVVSWASDRPVPMWLHIARELSEYWIHRQQLRQALELPSDLRADLAGPVLDALRWAFPYRLRPAPARIGDSVQITVLGAVDRRWFLVRSAAGWEFESACGSKTVGSMQISTDQAWRLLTNNLPRSEQFDLDGTQGIVTILLNTRAIIGESRWADDA